MSKPLFRLGQVVATPGGLAALADAGQEPWVFLQRHIAGDWGDMVDEDKEANDRALEDGTRTFSAYHTAKNVKIWVITEADRSATTILRPDEY